MLSPQVPSVAGVLSPGGIPGVIALREGDPMAGESEGQRSTEMTGNIQEKKARIGSLCT